MADVQRFPMIRHLRGAPTSYVRHERRGKLAREGTALSFWYRPLNAVLSEVPTDDRELPLLFHARTIDFQDVAVQATVTYRVIAPELITRRIDFSLDPDTGKWRSDPLDQIATVLTELAQEPVVQMVAELSLVAVLTAGPIAVRDRIANWLTDDPRLAEMGVSVLSVRVVAVRPEPELERAMQTPTRELVQQDSDKATFERRALAVERERAIAENELQSQIELAVREEHLVNQQGQNDRRRAEEAAAAEAVTVEAGAQRERVLAAARAEATRLIGAAEAETESAKLGAYRHIEPTILLALALRELAGGLPDIGTLNLSPDLITTALARLTSGDR